MSLMSSATRDEDHGVGAKRSQQRSLSPNMFDNWKSVVVSPTWREPENIKEMIRWCEDNCAGKWSHGSSWWDRQKPSYRFLFKGPNDRLAFALTWGVE